MNRRRTTGLDYPVHEPSESVIVQRKHLLRVIRGVGAGTRIRLGGTRLLAGRSEEADLFLDDPAASRQHFEIIPTTGGYVVRDLISTNGTRVGKVKILECRLANGDIISVGQLDIGYFEEIEIVTPDPGDA